MKKVLFITLALLPVFFLGCVNKNEKQEKTEAELELEKATSIAEKSEIKEKELFLGFEFGMTEKEVYDRINKLKKDKIIYINNENVYQYDFTTDAGLLLYVRFEPDYFNGKLYKFKYSIYNSIASTREDHVFLYKSFYDSDRGKKLKQHITYDIFGDVIYTGIKDNLVIKFESNSMIYINAPVNVLAEEKEKKEIDEKSKESNSNF